jgi:hypothetical protein
LLTNVAFTQSKKKKSSKKTKPSTTQTVTNKDDFNILDSGDYCKVTKPFIFVARDKATYQLLQNLVGKLSNVDFTTNALVAVFAGGKNSGGFTVSVNQNSNGKIIANLQNPPKNSIVTMALTQPYKIVSIPIEEEKPLQIELTETWQKQVQNYQITSSKFNYSGGFAGMSEDFEVTGNIGVMTFSDYTTFVFNLSGKGENKTKLLNETASGTLKKDEINLARLDAGSFADNPKPPMKVIGKLDKNLSLNFEPLPTIVSDGFEVRGELVANLIK